MPIPVLLAGVLGELAKNGLGLLASAIEAKGKDVVEDMIGVKIPDKKEDLTPELLATLQIKQMDHEVDLQKLALEFARLDVEDRKSARDREARANESANASWLSKNTTSVIALIVVLGGGLTLNFNPDTEVKYAVVSLMSLVLGYYFGTSMGSTKAQQALRDMVKK